MILPAFYVGNSQKTANRRVPSSCRSLAGSGKMHGNRWPRGW
ncbi:Uncharacterised protein [Vibrio cholerae]|nr:Uncharacterised protein [Vibrio cholerae]